MDHRSLSLIHPVASRNPVETSLTRSSLSHDTKNCHVFFPTFTASERCGERETKRGRENEKKSSDLGTANTMGAKYEMKPLRKQAHNAHSLEQAKHRNAPRRNAVPPSHHLYSYLTPPPSRILSSVCVTSRKNQP